MKDGAIICNSALRLRDQHELAARERRVKVERAEASGRGVHIPDRRTITVLAEGRLVNLACAEGHPASVMDMSRQPGARRQSASTSTPPSLGTKVYDVPAAIDDDVARVKLETLGIQIRHPHRADRLHELLELHKASTTVRPQVGGGHDNSSNGSLGGTAHWAVQSLRNLRASPSTDPRPPHIS